MTEENDKDRLFVTALARGLTVLSAFRSGESGLSNQELARRTGLPKSTVSRLTYTLTQLGYLSHEADSGFYRLGLAVLELGSVVLASYDIRRAAAPLMREFALANNVSVSLAMRDGSDMVYLETCRSGARVSVQLTVGSRVPIATTAIGRAYYVGLGAVERTRLDGELADRYGSDWPDIKTRLDAALTHFHRHGFTSSFGEFVPEVMAVGVPLPSPIPGQPPMSLNASGPAALFTPERFERDIAPALQEMARRIVPGAA